MKLSDITDLKTLKTLFMDDKITEAAFSERRSELEAMAAVETRRPITDLDRATRLIRLALTSPREPGLSIIGAAHLAASLLMSLRKDAVPVSARSFAVAVLAPLPTQGGDHDRAPSDLRTLLGVKPHAPIFLDDSTPISASLVKHIRSHGTGLFDISQITPRIGGEPSLALTFVKDARGQLATKIAAAALTDSDSLERAIQSALVEVSKGTITAVQIKSGAQMTRDEIIARDEAAVRSRIEWLEQRLEMGVIQDHQLDTLDRLYQDHDPESDRAGVVSKMVDARRAVAEPDAAAV